MQQNVPITAEMTVDTLLEVYPRTAAVFITHGTLCVGCWMSGFHTVAEVATLYNIKVENLLAELRQAAEYQEDANAHIDALGD